MEIKKKLAKNWQKKKPKKGQKKKLAKTWLVSDRNCIWHLLIKLPKNAKKYS